MTSNANEAPAELIAESRRRAAQFRSNTLEHERRRLTYFSSIANDKNKEKDSLNFTDLTLKHIFKNISQTFIGILNDISELNRFDLREFLGIFVKGDRIIYIGLLIVMISFISYLVDLF